MLQAYVEFGVGAHVDDAVVAWVFDLDLWGVCGQGTTEASALDALARAAADVRGVVPMRVVERIHGDEQAFARDHLPAADSERARTLEVLAEARRETLALIAACPDSGAGLGRSRAGAAAMGELAHPAGDGLACG